MSDRPVIRWRIGVLFVIGFLAMVTVPVALFYALRGSEEITGLPQPQQLAAIVDFAETTEPEARARAFAAMRSAQLSVRVAPEATVEADLGPLWPRTPARPDAYIALLDGRDFAAYAVPRGLFKFGPAKPLAAAEFRVGLADGSVLIVASRGIALFTSTGVPIGFPTAFLGVSIAFIALLMLNREFQMVLRLARAVDAIDPGDTQAKLPEIRARTSEVRLLIDAFQRQHRQVTTLLRARSALIGGIQHDVRTFATRLRLRIEKLSDPDDRRQAETDIEDLVALMDSALLASRSEADSLDLELFDLADLVRDEIRDQQEAGLQATVTVAPSAIGYDILGDRMALRRVLLNLVGNALRYGQSAHVHLLADEAIVTLRIDDDGPGIPEAMRADLMQPFARLEASRSRETGGAGLGLSIVQTLVSAHDGDVSITDTPGGGARVTVRLPRFAPTSRP